MILCIGDSMTDKYLDYETVRPSPEGDWPIVKHVKTWTQPGGAAAVAAMVEALGESCTLIANEKFGVERSLKTRHRIDGQVVFREDRDCTTDFAKRLADRLFGLDCNPDVVLVADYFHGAIDRTVIATCLERGWKIIVDPARNANPETYLGCWAIVPNRAENEANDYWNDYYRFPRCCLKRDRDGMTCRHDCNMVDFPAENTDPLDVTGAGDCVLATIGVMLARGESWGAACRMANTAAGIKCSKVGATPVTLAELEAVYV